MVPRGVGVRVSIVRSARPLLSKVVVVAFRVRNLHGRVRVGCTDACMRGNTVWVGNVSWLYINVVIPSNTRTVWHAGIVRVIAARMIVGRRNAR